MALAIKAWNLLGGMEWAGLETVADLLGIEDMEIMVTQLQTIRAFQADQRE